MAVEISLFDSSIALMIRSTGETICRQVMISIAVTNEKLTSAMIRIAYWNQEKAPST